MTTHLLLAEDNTELAGSLADYLSEVGFEVDFAFNGQSCLELVKANQYDIIVMDIMMPIQDGLSACRELRERYYNNTPVLFLTSRGSLDDKVEAYASGGDDYLVKPFAPEELVCRLNALLKRNQPTIRARQSLGNLMIDHRLQQASWKDKTLDLHDIQFKLLVLLAQAAPEPVSRLALESSLWPDGLPESDPLRSHIYRLRQQLDKPFDQTLIKTVHGKGYRLALPN